MEINQLVEQAKQHDEQAISQLMGMVAQKAKYIALSYVNDESKADDIVQETYIKAFSSLDKLVNPEGFEPWFYTILNNKAKDKIIRKLDKESSRFSELDYEDTNFEESIDDDYIEFQPKENFDYSELKSGMKEVLEDLPIAQKQAVLMHYFEGLNAREIGEIFDVSEDTIRGRIRYAKLKMKEKIEEMEKQGKSLRGVAPIPFLLWMLQTESTKVIPTKFTASSIASAVGSTQPPVLPTKSPSVSNISHHTTGKTVISQKGASASVARSSAVGVSTATKTTVTGLSAKALAGITAAVVGIGSVTGYTVVNSYGSTILEFLNLNKQYTIISEDVPQFDEVPISMFEKGYFAMVDGEYGYIDSDGDWIIEPDYEVISIMEDFQTKEYSVCGFHTIEDSESRSVTDLSGVRLDTEIKKQEEENCVNTGMGGTGPRYVYYQGDVRVNEGGELLDKKDSTLPSKPTNSVVIYEYTSSNKYNFDTLYIYNEGNEKVYGPYSKEDIPNFRLMPMDNSSDLEYINTHWTNPDVYGLYWVKEDGQYRIIHTNGDESDDLYDQVTVLFDDSILVRKENQWGIVDKKLNFIDLKDTSIEAMTKPIDGKCYIKKDGRWMLVQLASHLAELTKEELSEEEKIVYPEGTYHVSGMFRDFTFYPDGRVIEYQSSGPNTIPNTTPWGWRQYGALEFISRDGDIITFKKVYYDAEEYSGDTDETRPMEIVNNNITFEYQVSTNSIRFDDGSFRPLS